LAAIFAASVLLAAPATAGKLSVTVVNGTGAVAGAEVPGKDDNGEEVGRGVANRRDGQVAFESKMAQATVPGPKPTATVSLTVKVSNPHGKPPVGATVVVKDKNGKEVASGTTKPPSAEEKKSDPGNTEPFVRFDLPVGAYTVETKFTSDSDTKYEGKQDVELTPENRSPLLWIDGKLVKDEEQKAAEDKTKEQKPAPDKTATGAAPQTQTPALTPGSKPPAGAAEPGTKPAADAKPAATSKVTVVVEDPASSSPSSGVNTAKVVVKDKDGKVVATGYTAQGKVHYGTGGQVYSEPDSATLDLPPGAYTIESEFTSAVTGEKKKATADVVVEPKKPLYVITKGYPVKTEEKKAAEDKTGGQKRAPDKTATGRVDSLTTRTVDEMKSLVGFSLETDHPKHVLLPSGIDPMNVIKDFGMRGATFFPIPQGAGGGFSLTGYVDDAQWQKIEDRFCQTDPDACSTNSCKEWLFPDIGATPRLSPTPLQRISMHDSSGYVNAPASGSSTPSYKGGVKDGTGKPLAGSTVTLFPPEPKIETVLDDDPKNDPAWTSEGLIQLAVDHKGEFEISWEIMEKFVSQFRIARMIDGGGGQDYQETKVEQPDLSKTGEVFARPLTIAERWEKLIDFLHALEEEDFDEIGPSKTAGQTTGQTPAPGQAAVNGQGAKVAQTTGGDVAYCPGCGKEHRFPPGEAPGGGQDYQETKVEQPDLSKTGEVFGGGATAGKFNVYVGSIDNVVGTAKVTIKDQTGKVVARGDTSRKTVENGSGGSTEFQQVVFDNLPFGEYIVETIFENKARQDVRKVHDVAQVVHNATNSFYTAGVPVPTEGLSAEEMRIASEAMLAELDQVKTAGQTTGGGGTGSGAGKAGGGSGTGKAGGWEICAAAGWESTCMPFANSFMIYQTERPKEQFEKDAQQFFGKSGR
jgi:hypothetical protein